MSSPKNQSESPADGAALAALGLDLATIETCEDVQRLWRAVRELVLTGRVVEPIQQRILRRVWAADAELRVGSFDDSVEN